MDPATTWLLVIGLGIPAVVGMGLVVWGAVRLIKHMNQQARVVVDDQGRIKVKVRSGSSWVEQPAEEVLEKPKRSLLQKWVSWVLVASAISLLIMVIILARRVSLGLVIAMVVVSLIADLAFIFVFLRKKDK